MSHYRVGVNIGGTFTDIVLLDAEGRNTEQEPDYRINTTDSNGAAELR